MKKINTVRFGELEIEEDKIVQFDEGGNAFVKLDNLVLLNLQLAKTYRVDLFHALLTSYIILL